MKVSNSKNQLCPGLLFVLVSFLAFTSCETNGLTNYYIPCIGDDEFTSHHRMKVSYETVEVPYSITLYDDAHTLQDMPRDRNISIHVSGTANNMCNTVRIRSISGIPIRDGELYNGDDYMIKRDYLIEQPDREYCTIRMGCQLMPPGEYISAGIIYVDFYYGDCSDDEPAETVVLNIFYED